MAERKAKQQKDLIVFSRINPELHRSLMDEAKRQRRSMTKQLTVILEERYKKDGVPST